MTYDLEVTDRDGRARRVHGVKRLVRGARPEIWADSTIADHRGAGRAGGPTSWRRGSCGSARAASCVS